MNTYVIILLGVLEVVAVCVSVHLWFQQRRMRIIPRIFWSVVLLVPLFGLLVFVFIRSDLDKNADRMDSQADTDAFYGGGGGL
jgi:hypothetical protein